MYLSSNECYAFYGHIHSVLSLYLSCKDIHSGAAYSCTNEHESEIYESNIMCML